MHGHSKSQGSAGNAIGSGRRGGCRGQYSPSTTPVSTHATQYQYDHHGMGIGSRARGSMSRPACMHHATTT